MTARAVANSIHLANKTVTVYASPKIGQALQAVVGNLDLFHGVKLIQLLEAVYDQGTKDGARKAIDAMSTRLDEVIRQVPHRNPGKPKSKR